MVVKERIPRLLVEAAHFLTDSSVLLPSLAQAAPGTDSGPADFSNDAFWQAMGDSHKSYVDTAKQSDFQPEEGGDDGDGNGDFPGLDVILAALRFMDDNPKHGLVVAGHTDRAGSEAHNDELSGGRARCTAALVAGDRDKNAALALQYGLGHCGELATCSFSVLRSIMKGPGNKVAAAILSGNANIDHAFVVYNLVPDNVIATKATNPANTRVGLGGALSVFNLADAIVNNPTRVGFVMDPYLDKSVMKPTADELLDSLNSAKRKAQGKDTDFLAFDNFNLLLPFKPTTIDDVTGKTVKERKALVKNL